MVGSAIWKCNTFKGEVQAPVNLSIFSRIWHKVALDNIFWILFRSTIGLRLAGGPGGFLCLGSGMSVAWPTALIGRRFSKTELMMCVIGLDMTSLAYFRSSLMMPSRPEVRPLFKDFSTFLASASLTGDCRDLGSLVKGCSGSSSGSVNCSLNHSWITSAFPWSVTVK